MRYQPALQNVSVAIVGNFNPAIISPAWLKLNDVVTNGEFETTQLTIIHPEIADFTMESLQIQVTPQKFVAITKEIPFIRVADLTMEIFGRLLPHTPVQQVGINFLIHFGLPSSRMRTALGRDLAPLAPWGEWGASLNTEIGGVRSMVMEEGNIEGRKVGSYRRAQIEPSLLPELQQSGVFMAINDHFVLENPSATTEELVGTIANNFDSSVQKSMSIVSDIMEYASKL